MSATADSAAREKLLRQIPSVDELLARPALVRLVERAGRSLVLETARQILAALRTELTLDAGSAAAALAPEALDLVEGKMAFAVVNGKLKMTHVDDIVDEPVAAPAKPAEPVEATDESA